MLRNHKENRKAQTPTGRESRTGQRLLKQEVRTLPFSSLGRKPVAILAGEMVILLNEIAFGLHVKNLALALLAQFKNPDRRKGPKGSRAGPQ